MFPWGIFHVLKAQYFNHRASFYLIGVHPDYQNKGVTAIIFNEIQKVIQQERDYHRGNQSRVGRERCHQKYVEEL